MIPLGDIYLRDELELDKGLRTIGRLRDRGSVRRMYSATVVGLEGNMTVAMYRGDGAEKVCHSTSLMYILSNLTAMAGGYFATLVASVSETWCCSSMLMGLSVSHPCFVQLCGITTSSTMCAAVFHGGMLFD
jgi:hypothetical protein